MAEAAAKHYKVSAGFTTNLGVAKEGQIVRAEDMVSGDTEFKPMSVEDQQAHFGRILYEPYEAEEGDIIAGSEPVGPGAIGDSPITDPAQNDAQRAELPEHMVDKDAPSTSQAPSTSDAPATSSKTTSAADTGTTRRSSSSGSST